MILIKDNILTEAECYQLIGMGQEKMTQADTLGVKIDGYRTAENSWLFDENELTHKIKNIVYKETGLPIENQETIHIVKYQIGGEYKSHHDFFHENSDYYQSAMGSAGQRVFSCLFYLNEGFNGGETEFPTKKITVTPRKGRLLVWRNMDENGKVDYESLHAGLPVKSGVKWIAIVWVRENSFISTPIETNESQNIVEPTSDIVRHLGKILSDEDCKNITNEIISAFERGELPYEADDNHYKNSHGGIVTALYPLFDRLHPIAEDVVGKPLDKQNPYCRIYLKGSTLKPHVDREGLEWTISVCVYDDTNSNWKLNVRQKDNSTTSFTTRIGEGCIMPGRKLEHWRDDLECEDGKKIIQLFFHWSEKK